MSTSIVKSIVQVTVHFFKKDDKFLYSDVEELSGFLDDDTMEVKMEEPPDDGLIHAMRGYDTIALRDFVMFSFKSVSDEIIDGCSDVFEHEVAVSGLEHVFTKGCFKKFAGIADGLEFSSGGGLFKAFLILFTAVYSSYEDSWSGGIEWDVEYDWCRFDLTMMNNKGGFIPSDSDVRGMILC